MMFASCFIVLPMKKYTNELENCKGGMVNSRSTTSKKYTPMLQNILVGGFLNIYNPYSGITNQSESLNFVLIAKDGKKLK